MESLTNTLLDDKSDDSLDWLIHTPVYLTWSCVSSDDARQLPVLWYRTNETVRRSTAFGLLLLKNGDTIIHINNYHPVLSNFHMLHGHGCSERAASALLSLLQQAYMLNFDDGDFCRFIVDNAIFDRKTGSPKLFCTEVTRILAQLLRIDRDRRWTILIHDVDSLGKDVAIEIDRLLSRLLNASSWLRVANLKVAAIGQEPKKMPQLVPHAAVVDDKTEYSGMTGAGSYTQ